MKTNAISDYFRHAIEICSLDQEKRGWLLLSGVSTQGEDFGHIFAGK